MVAERTVLARARTDASDCLVEADEPLASLQRRCGGELPGTLAVPQLLEAVQKARTMGLKLARSITATDGEESIRAWVEISPENSAEQTGCTITVASWHSAPNSPEADADTAARHIMIDRAVAELTARLDEAQRPIAVEVNAPDLVELGGLLRTGRDRPWSEWLTFPDLAHHQPLHWRLLDGARCRAPGSERLWTATLVPLGRPEPGSAGFELLLVANAPLPDSQSPPEEDAPTSTGFGHDLTPVLRPPIARIIANAETIRSRLAGPLADEYSNYAADIAAAGQHLLSLVDDLADLDIVEANGFATAPDPIDLADVARRAVGILGVRAQAKEISLNAPAAGESLPATGEFRRVLQILLNLVGNAIAYSPAGSEVTVTLGGEQGGTAHVTVADQGPGLKQEQAARVFNKFERLGRSGDGGSGLGLYISRRLARAMGGDLTVESEVGAGARFILTLPVAG